MSAGEPPGPYYVVIDVAIRDVDRYLTYMAQVAPAIEAAGGRYRARGGAGPGRRRQPGRASAGGVRLTRTGTVGR